MPYQPIYGGPSGVESTMEAQNAQMGKMWGQLLSAYMGGSSGSAAPAGTTSGYDEAGNAVDFAPGANVYGTYNKAGQYSAPTAVGGGFD